MTLRVKTMLLVSLTLIGLLFALFLAVRPVVLGGFARIEQQDARDTTEVLQRLLQSRFAAFAGNFQGYAAREDLYNAARDADSAPFKRIFTRRTLRSLDLKWVAVVNPSGDLIFSTGFDPNTGRPILLPPDLIGHLRPKDPLLNFGKAKQANGGLLSVPNGALLVASVPIITENTDSTPAGSLILARTFGSQDPLLRNLPASGRRIQVVTFTGDALPGEFESARQTLTSRTVLIQTLNDQFIAGYTLLRDFYGDEVAVLQVTAPRVIYWQADTTMRFFGCVMALSVLFFVALSMLPLEQLVLSRLDRLAREVDEVRESGNPERRVSAPGKDELAVLGQNINATLSALQKAAGRLSRSEEMYREMAQTALSAGDAYFILHPGEKTLVWHGDIDYLLGYSPGGFRRTEEAWLEQIHARDRQRVARAYARSLALNESFEVEFRILRRDGELRHWANRGRPISDEGESSARLVCVCTDITEKKESEEALRESEQRLQRVVETAADAIIITNREGHITFANDAAAQTFGLLRDEIEQLRVDDPSWCLADLDGEPLAPAELPFASVRANGAAVYEFEHTVERPDGRRIVVSVNAAPLLDARGMFSGMVASYTDVTARRAMQDRLTYQAFHDPLTGLANRSLLKDRLQHALTRRGGEADIALLFIDLDNFKYINDSLGHAVGDELLATVADRLRQSLRAGDTAARFGGDEFVVLLESVEDHRYSIHVAERLLEALQEPLIIEGREVFTTPSIGIVHSTGQGDQADELIRHADAAMYEAKKRGKARYEVFQSRMSTSAMARLEIENDLRRALQRQEFLLHYQPKLHLPSGRIYGFEALVRWKHPEHGLISPGEFVPIAEETGLIVPMGFWILREACLRAQEWNSHLSKRPRNVPAPAPEANGHAGPGYTNGNHTNGNGHSLARESVPELDGLPAPAPNSPAPLEGAQPAPGPYDWLSISVNVSARQLTHPDFMANISEILNETQLSPDQLILEITESVIVEQTGATLETLNALKALGVRLAIDDFGTGYSSLAYLRAFPFDFLKIDRQFVAKLHEEGGNSVIVSSMINLAHALNLVVIAEGAEHLEEVEKLKALDCDLAQGYFFGRPMPREEIDTLLMAKAA